jgi:hypothetical protein
MEQLLYLLCVLIVIIMGSLMYQKLYVKEGFASIKEGLRSCPLNMKHYYDSQDNSSCCDGRLEGGICIPKEGVNRSCILGSAKHDKPSCRQVLQEYYKDMGAEFCPKGLNYYKTMSVVPNSPVPLVLVQFTDLNGSRHSCYTDDSYSSYKASLKTAATGSENPLQLCSAAYAKFVDRKEV